MSHALVFPGQGSQQEGMARPWRGHPAFHLWAVADEVCDRDVTRLGLTATADELREPWACQVALFVHHAVLLEAWRELGEPVTVVAGHSLGEYNALLAAGAVGFPDALRLVEARARCTAEAAADPPGGMVACLGVDSEALSQAASRAGVHIANDNAPGQVVVSGTLQGLDLLAELLREQPGRVVPLPVGAAYHSPLMEPAAATFADVLDTAVFTDAEVPVIANVDATARRDAAEWPGLLRRQLTAPVRWRQTVEGFGPAGIREVTELAAAPVLTGLTKRVDRTLRRRVLTTPDDVVEAMGVVA